MSVGCAKEASESPEFVSDPVILEIVKQKAREQFPAMTHTKAYTNGRGNDVVNVKEKRGTLHALEVMPYDTIVESD